VARGNEQIGRFKRRARTMLIGQEELIEEIESHIRKSGGGFGEWSIGTAEGQWLVVSG
jgi:hypothetical protein